MKYKDYDQVVNPGLLHQELESIKGMITMVDLDGVEVKKAHYMMFIFEPKGTRIQVEEGIDDTFVQIDAIMASHDNTQLSDDQLTMADKEINRSSGFEKLRAAGLTDNELAALFGE